MRLVSRLALFAAASLAPCLAYAQQAPAVAPQPEEGAGEEPGEEIIVQATRSGRRVQDEPVRVEVIDRDELDEKLMMRPGNVAMVLSETGGLRVQVTSPALGAANIRVQGMDGRYTLLLADGFPRPRSAEIRPAEHCAHDRRRAFPAHRCLGASPDCGLDCRAALTVARVEGREARYATRPSASVGSGCLSLALAF